MGPCGTVGIDERFSRYDDRIRDLATVGGGHDLPHRPDTSDPMFSEDILALAPQRVR